MAVPPVEAQPLELPGAQFSQPPAPVPQPAAPAAPSLPTTPDAPTAPLPVAPPGTVADPAAPALPPPADITELTLHRDAREGALDIARTGQGLAATLTLEGRGISNPQEACAVTIADGVRGAEGEEGVALSPVTPLGRYARYRLAAPACPVVVTLFADAAILWHEGFCTFEAADCRVDPNGVWGPRADALPTDPVRLERDLAEADEAVRAAFRTLAERSEGDALRAVLAEQAGFSAERVTACARYEGEERQGLCAARWTQARAAGLQERLGTTPAPVPRADAPAAVPEAPAPLSILPTDN
ncbi:DUF1311 domain-containing protein [Salinarimonas rosea]|uniref:DUF1311 domain-containing protein n=1 Tax=Salinarimonas rosea TaxID=552063 RepID=UPI00041F48B9|nr:DUF1311 domain-containing protein [Salinarimonas rosea]